MDTIYEIHSGRRALARQHGSTSYEVLVDYLRSLGCSDDELVRAGTDAVSWRGAVYTAIPVAQADPAFSRRAA